MQLESTIGRHASLDAHRGRAVVIFYEAYGHLRDNDTLKRACGRMVERGDYGDRLRVLGVASLGGLPAMRALVRVAVRAAAGYYGVELWMDWEGELARPPLSLSAGSNVAVLGPDGTVLFRARGTVTNERAFYDALSCALAQAEAHVSANGSAPSPASSSAPREAPPRSRTEAETSATSRSHR